MALDRKLTRFVLIQIVLAVSLSIIISSGMKVMFEVPRPCEGAGECPESFSFPSRHAAAAFATASIFMLYSRNFFHKTLVFVIAAIVGYYRISIGVHTEYDVVVGAAVGLLTAVGVYFLIRSRKKYRKFFK